MDECKRRVLKYMKANRKRYRFFRASQLAYVIWPGEEFLRAQGAGAAASRVLKHMERDKTVRWSSGDGDWGYQLV